MVHLLNFIFPKTMAMAMELKKAESIVTGVSVPILHHLVKILYFEDNVNYNKHCNDLDTWISKADDIFVVPRSRKLKDTQYYKWLFTEPYDGIPSLNRIIRKSLRGYSDLHTLRTPEEVNKLLYGIYTRLSIDLSKDTFETIKDYLPKE